MGAIGRQRAAPLDRDRGAPAGPGARGLLEPVRRTQDARADRVYVEDRESAQELVCKLAGLRARERSYDRLRPWIAHRARPWNPGALGMDVAGGPRAWRQSSCVELFAER